MQGLRTQEHTAAVSLHGQYDQMPHLLMKAPSYPKAVNSDLQKLRLLQLPQNLQRSKDSFDYL